MRALFPKYLRNSYDFSYIHSISKQSCRNFSAATRGLCQPPKPSVSFVPCPCLAPTDSRDRRFPFGGQVFHSSTGSAIPKKNDLMYILNHYIQWNDFDVHVKSVRSITSCEMILFFVQWGHFCRWKTAFQENPSCRWLACLASCSVSFVSYRAKKLKQSSADELLIMLISCTLITICPCRNP